MNRSPRSEEHTSELQSPCNLVCRLLLEKKTTTLYKVRERRKPNILDYLTSKEIKLVINIPSHEQEAESRLILRDEYIIRRKAAEFGIPVVTNLELARALVKALVSYNGRIAHPASSDALDQTAPASPKEVPKTGSMNARQPMTVSPAV